MKTKLTVIAAIGAISALAFMANAQDNSGPQNQRPGGPGMRGHRPPPNPVCQALDANHDGVIDADEIANASAALKTLDKNGDGKLTEDELRPQRPLHGHDRDDNNNPPAEPPPADQ